MRQATRSGGVRRWTSTWRFSGGSLTCWSDAHTRIRRERRDITATFQTEVAEQLCSYRPGYEAKRTASVFQTAVTWATASLPKRFTGPFR